MSTLTRFDLNALVHSVVDSDTSGDVHQMAKALAASLTPEDFPAFIEAVAPRIIRDGIRSHRGAIDLPGGTAPRLQSNPSRYARWKKAGIYAEYLSRMESVRDGHYVPVGDLTADQLATVIEDRKRQAAGMVEQVERLERLLAAVVACGVKTPGQLSQAQLSEALL